MREGKYCSGWLRMGRWVWRAGSVPVWRWRGRGRGIGCGWKRSLKELERGRWTRRRLRRRLPHYERDRQSLPRVRLWLRLIPRPYRLRPHLRLALLIRLTHPFHRPSRTSCTRIRTQFTLRDHPRCRTTGLKQLVPVHPLSPLHPRLYPLDQSGSHNGVWASYPLRARR